MAGILDSLGSFGRFAGGGLRMLHTLACRYAGRPPRYLPVLLMFVTDHCNLRCRMCGVCELEKLRAGEPELSTEEWFAVLDSAARLGTMLVSISGGEPLLRRDLYDIIGRARGHGMTVHLCSNGALMTPSHAERLAAAGVSTFSISLEGPEGAHHDHLRGAGTHAAALEAIRLVREKGPGIRIGINYLITKGNFRNMPEMLAFAEGVGAHQVKFAPIHVNLLHRLKEPAAYDGLVFGPEDLPALEEELGKLRAACRKSRLLTTSDAFFDGIPDLYRVPRRFQCHAGWAVAAVDPKGRLSPCADMEGRFSVRTRPLEEIWRSPEFHKERGKVLRCESACWDTTNTELSLRLRPAGLLGAVAQNLRDIRFYFGKKP